MHWLLNHNYNRQSIGFNVQMNFIQFMNKTKSKSNNKVIINRIKFLQRIPRQLAIQRFIPIPAFYAHFSVLSPFQHFIRNSAFYPHFSVLFHFSVLSPIQCFIPISVSVSAIQFQRFIPTLLIKAFLRTKQYTHTPNAC